MQVRVMGDWRDRPKRCCTLLPPQPGQPPRARVVELCVFSASSPLLPNVARLRVDVHASNRRLRYTATTSSALESANHVDASRTPSAPWPARAGPFLTLGCPCSGMRGRCSSMVKRVVRSTRVPIAELPSPRIRSPSQCPGTGPILSLGGSLADHDFRCDETFSAFSGARPRHPQRTAGAQAGAQLPAQRPAASDVERLIDRLMRDPHGLIIGKIDPQAVGDLLGAPRGGPPSMLSAAVPTPDPAGFRTGHRLAVCRGDLPGHPVLHVLF